MAKRKKGRPQLKAGKRVRLYVTLPQDVIDYLGEIGNNNRSAAIEMLARDRAGRGK